MKALLLAATILFSIPALAQEMGPDQLVQKVTEEVLATIKVRVASVC